MATIATLVEKAQFDGNVHTDDDFDINGVDGVRYFIVFGCVRATPLSGQSSQHSAQR